MSTDIAWWREHVRLLRDAPCINMNQGDLLEILDELETVKGRNAELERLLAISETTISSLQKAMAATLAPVDDTDLGGTNEDIAHLIEPAPAVEEQGA